MNGWTVRNIIFPLQERLMNRKTMSYLRELEATQWYSVSQLFEYQNRKLRALVKYCYKNVPYYMNIFEKTQLAPDAVADLTRLPLLTKKIIKENADRLIHHNAKQSLIRMNTGGSTGEPLIFYVDKRRQAYDKASNLRSRRWWGIDIGDKEIVFWGSPIEIKKQDVLKSFRDKLTNTKLLSAFNMTENTMRDYADIIRAYKPRHVFGYPSSIYLFSQYLNRNNIKMDDLGIKVIFVTAEVLHDFQKEEISKTFKCPVANGYGGRDSGFIAHECPEGNMHITEDIIVEIVKDGNVVSDGEAGEIVVTHLDCYGMPFIRYMTGDVATKVSSSCKCGRNLPILEKIEGRYTDFIKTVDGRTMHGLSLIYILRDLEGIERFKIIQKDINRLHIYIIKNSVYSMKSETIIKEKIRNLMRDVEVDIFYKENFEESRSGKFRYVVSELA